ncbi:MAG: 16S rRNA (cytosine(967)-C(5))-methyltransferase RsmB [Desulfobacterales bacterium]|nr:16S rRNA (cytosine(967)-C(5))-methyltransferase RsmB [Desulfobacterales bacterium]
MADYTRNTALFILNTLDRGHKTLDRILDEDITDKEQYLSKRDRALVNALVYGVIRRRGTLDWIIDYFSNTRLNAIDSNILNILRIGLFQVIFLDKIPVSAAVNTSVEMAKSSTSPKVAGFVNAVLRSSAKGYKKVPFPDRDKDPVKALSTAKSFPEWLIKRWLDRFGLKETEVLCDAVNNIPPITVRTNNLKISRDDLINKLESDVELIDYTSYSPDGICFFKPKLPVSKMKAFKSGWFQVQDEAAQLVTCLLNPQPGETILDACAGLGGKTGHIAQLMRNKGKIVAMDKNNEKLLRHKSEMKRLGISIVQTCVHNLNKPFDKNYIDGFDRILLDAPCSGLGVLRRNPDIKWLMSKKNLIHYKEKQVRFLDILSHLVKPSGILVYAVCSTEPEENEEVIKVFLNNHPEFVVEKKPDGLPFNIRFLVNKNGYLITFPHTNNMDGFFAVCLRNVEVI